MGSTIWQKKTTMNTTGGATVMGSFPYPPNGIVEIDYEFIHIFKNREKGKEFQKRSKRHQNSQKKNGRSIFQGTGILEEQSK